LCKSPKGVKAIIEVPMEKKKAINVNQNHAFTWRLVEKHLSSRNMYIPFDIFYIFIINYIAAMFFKNKLSPF
jgi:hypothetical protein